MPYVYYVTFEIVSACYYFNNLVSTIVTFDMYFYQMKKDIIVNIIIIIIIKEGEKEIWLLIAEVPLALFVKTTAFNTLHF